MTPFPFPNAFTINKLGVDAVPFPFSIESKQKGQVSSIFICPQRVIDLCDLIAEYAFEKLIVFDVGHVAVAETQTMTLLTLAELVSRADIDHTIVDSNTILLSRKDLGSFLSHFSHYDFRAFDINSDWSEEQIIGQVITVQEHNWHSRLPQLLSLLNHSSLFIDCHDDCYLILESHNSSLIKRVFARALQIYVGTVLVEDFRVLPPQSEITTDNIDALWSDTVSLTILRDMTTYQGDKLIVGVAKRTFSFAESAEYPIEFNIEYDLVSQKWAVTNRRF